MVDLVIIDEAHHQSAETYQEILRFFQGVKTIGLTATPFRSDGKNVEGTKVYSYHFHQAISDKVIRNIVVANVTPEEILLSFSDDEGQKFDFNEIMKLKEENWFNRGIALSQDCCDSIARKANDKLEFLKKHFQNTSHQIIAAAMSRRHAREYVKPAFEKLGLKVGLVSSHPEEKATNEKVFKELDQGKIQVIIHIGMLGEGFDHRPLGVAAIFRPFKSLNPYIQFIGRVIRRNQSTDRCFVVSHIGLNQIARFEEFRLFDEQDQKFLESLQRNGAGSLGSDISFLPSDELPTNDTHQGDQIRVKEVGGELLSFESSYVKGADSVVQLAGNIKKLSDSEKERLFDMLGVSADSVSKQKKKRLKPIDERKASRSLLNEREKSIATDVVKHLGLEMYGRDFNPLYKNFLWVKKKVSKSVNACLGIKAGQRKELTQEQIHKLETDELIKQIRKDCLGYFADKLNEKLSKKTANA